MWRNKLKTAGFLMHTLSSYKSFIIFDTETMGLKDFDKILQFSGVLYEIDNEKLTFTEKETINLFMNPREKIPKKITKITGISNEFICTEPDEEKVAPAILDFLGKADFWMAYNAIFDYTKIIGMASRCQQQVEKRPVLDLLPMVRDCYIGEVDDFKLSTIAEYCHPEGDWTFHSAIDDVKASEIVFRSCIKVYQQAILDSYDDPKKRTVHLNWASLSINPKQPSMQRIKLNINDDRYGNIFWDLRNKCWDFKKDKYSRELFHEIDLDNLESQFIKKYGPRYGTSNIDQLTTFWLKEYKEKQKSQKTA